MSITGTTFPATNSSWFDFTTSMFVCESYSSSCLHAAFPWRQVRPCQSLWSFHLLLSESPRLPCRTSRAPWRRSLPWPVSNILRARCAMPSDSPSPLCPHLRRFPVPFPRGAASRGRSLACNSCARKHRESREQDGDIATFYRKEPVPPGELAICGAKQRRQDVMQLDRPQQ